MFSVVFVPTDAIQLFVDWLTSSKLSESEGNPKTIEPACLLDLRNPTGPAAVPAEMYLQKESCCSTAKVQHLMQYNRNHVVEQQYLYCILL